MLADVLTNAMTKVPPSLEHVLSQGKLSLVESAEAKRVLEGRQDAENSDNLPEIYPREKLMSVVLPVFLRR